MQYIEVRTFYNIQEDWWYKILIDSTMKRGDMLLVFSCLWLVYVSPVGFYWV